ncbi:iron-containing alcohol dehydrogenase [Iocasia frigidifontis]|uniref:Iron-containing alcohol dehydrogenase n=1 Tax=Iocasia fonsfrigidae TaxID=2682810 RepID=A0A8A7K8S5_9FIRM|nr:iron-containing alcohol dehydrogenase [Iocasia fonsfrigidae]QTL98203.1 iron-containing alcohol dehydrogenase [Iocasia fonsfrigidae]
MINSFNFAGVPTIKFGAGNFKKLADLVLNYGDCVLLLTGGESLKKSGRLAALMDMLVEKSINPFVESVKGEPSPGLVDEIVGKYRNKSINSVAAIGGGSVLDTGKAVSALLTKGDSVMNYLEGVGVGKVHDGEKIPFIAVPTTSGTGSEATKNAVLSRVGDNGFKKSLRHDNFIPDIALLDPELTLNCPADITAASGLDALTQLLGAYTSIEASPLTDSLTYQGIKYAVEAIIPVSTSQPENLELRTKMAYASLISGIALANAGLGIVHGLASPIGGFFDIPHGVVCGTLLAEATALNISLLQEKGGSEADKYLQKYARVGVLFSNCENELSLLINRDKYCEILVNKLRDWIDKLAIPRLSEYGISENDLERIIEKAGIKNNPVKLSKKQIRNLLKKRL